MAKSTRNAQSKTAEKLDITAGNRIFCLKRKHDFSEIYEDYHKVSKGFLDEYSLDRLQLKTDVNFIEFNFF